MKNNSYNINYEFPYFNIMTYVILIYHVKLSFELQ